MAKSLAAIKSYLSFWLTFLSISGSLYLGYTKGIDLTVLLPALLGIYVTNRTAEKVSTHWAASKDADADTEKVIEMISGGK
jgi:hypothetical protein